MFEFTDPFRLPGDADDAPSDAGVDDRDDDCLDDEPLMVDCDGMLVERRTVLGIEVIVHHVDDIPDSDVTSVAGVPCTTPLRTVIDLAPDLDDAHLERVVRDCLARRLFTVDEAWCRLAQPDMANRTGAALLGHVLERMAA